MRQGKLYTLYAAKRKVSYISVPEATNLISPTKTSKTQATILVKKAPIPNRNSAAAFNALNIFNFVKPSRKSSPAFTIDVNEYMSAVDEKDLSLALY